MYNNHYQTFADIPDNEKYIDNLKAQLKLYIPKTNQSNVFEKYKKIMKTRYFDRGLICNDIEDLSINEGYNLKLIRLENKNNLTFTCSCSSKHYKKYNNENNVNKLLSNKNSKLNSSDSQKLSNNFTNTISDICSSNNESDNSYILNNNYKIHSLLFNSDNTTLLNNNNFNKYKCKNNICNKYITTSNGNKKTTKNKAINNSELAICNKTKNIDSSNSITTLKKSRKVKRSNKESCKFRIKFIFNNTGVFLFNSLTTHNHYPISSLEVSSIKFLYCY